MTPIALLQIAGIFYLVNTLLMVLYSAFVLDDWRRSYDRTRPLGRLALAHFLVPFGALDLDGSMRRLPTPADRAVLYEGALIPLVNTLLLIVALVILTGEGLWQLIHLGRTPKSATH